MASGFIILKDRSCFAGRWTGYDEIIRISIRELKLIDDSDELIEILCAKIPINDEENEGEMGWGFVGISGEIVSRELDLRGLSDQHHSIFWIALKKGYEKLVKLGPDYSFLKPEFLEHFLKKKKLSGGNGNPLDHSDWNVLADEKFEILSSNEE